MYGKTAIAQGLAIKIAEKNVPAKLLNKQVYLLDMTAVIAGTQFRGQFEGRMKALIDECKQSGNHQSQCNSHGGQSQCPASGIHRSGHRWCRTGYHPEFQR